MPDSAERPKLLFLTNLYNGSPEEDIFLTEQLRKHFTISIVHPLDSEAVEDNFTTALVRNIWPSHEYKDQKAALIRRLTRKGLLPASEAERGYLEQDNYLEKEYLLDIYAKGYPVIPTIDSVSNLEVLGDCAAYFIKPKDRCDGEGSEKLSREELIKRELTDYLIQPHIAFDYEVCFYFVDGAFVYAFKVSNRLAGKDYEPYQPSPDDMAFAEKFVRWNRLDYGLQRVDAVRVHDTQELLLTELEDFGPYLYILELPEPVREKAVRSIVESLLKRL